MDEEARNAFVVEPHTAVLSTTGKEGRIHSVPVWYLWQDGVFRILTLRGSQKQRNIERSGRATLCIDSRERGNVRWATAEGTATVEEPVTKALRLALWTHYMGAAAEKALERAGDNTAQSVCLVIRPERWLS